MERKSKGDKMKITKIILNIFLIILLGLMLITACNNKGDKTQTSVNTNFGINVSGGTEGKSWEVDESTQRLIIKEDGLVLNGLANTDLRIVCRDNVATLAIEGLDQGSKQVIIFSSPNENTGFVLKFKGENMIYKIEGQDMLTLKGVNKDSQLSLSNVRAAKDLMIEDATIYGGSFRAYRDIIIKGVSVIKAERTPDESEESLTAMLTADRNINIELELGGNLSIKETLNIYPLFAQKKINLRKDNKIILPKKGTIKSANTPYGPDCQFVFDSQGGEASEVVISNTATK